jgi:hypothetical protein
MKFYIHITFLCTIYMEFTKTFLRDVMRRVRVPLTIFLERFPIRKIVSGTHAIPHMYAHIKSFQNENVIHSTYIYVFLIYMYIHHVICLQIYAESSCFLS